MFGREAKTALPVIATPPDYDVCAQRTIATDQEDRVNLFRENNRIAATREVSRRAVAIYADVL